MPGTLRSGLLSPAAVLALVRWAGPAVASPRRVVAGADRTVREGLDRVGLRGPLRSEVLEPFLAGVVAEDAGDTSDAFVRLLVRMFALGVPGVPARGIRALPEQLAARAVARGVVLRTGAEVVAVERLGGSGGAGGSGARAVLATGERVTGRAVVVAVGAQAVGSLLDVPAPATKGLQTWWFTTPDAPTTSTMLAVDGRRRGPVLNTAVMSNAAPTYTVGWPPPRPGDLPPAARGVGRGGRHGGRRAAAGGGGLRRRRLRLDARAARRRPPRPAGAGGSAAHDVGRPLR